MTALNLAQELKEWLLSPYGLALLGLFIGSFLNVVIHRLPKMLEQAWQTECRLLLQQDEVLKTTPCSLLQGANQAQDSADKLAIKDAYKGPDQEATQESPHLSQGEAQKAKAAHTKLLEHELNLCTPRSRCPFCGHMITWFENIPVLSFCFLRGRCRACKNPISWRYPVIEIQTAILFFAVAVREGPLGSSLLWCTFMAILLALSWIDWDTTLLPDQLTLPLLWLGLLAALLGWATLSVNAALWGAIAGYLSLWSVYWIFKLITGKEGMGFGDFKLLAALGAWLGVSMILPIVLAASVIGVIIGLGLKFNRALRDGLYVPFGPFLAGAGIAVYFVGSARLSVWMHWL